jgi:phage terminase large subunit-like protein
MQGDLFLLVNCGYDLDFRPHWEHLFPRVSDENPYLVAPTLRDWLISRCLKIRTVEGRRVLLHLNRAQAEYSRTCSRRNIVLKARQLGMTTYIAARFFIETIMRPGTLTVQIAHNQESAEQIFRIVHRFWENLPRGVHRGALIRSRANIRQIVFPRLDSEYRVATAADENAGRGLTIQNLHCSEVARWPRGGVEVLASLRGAVPPSGQIVLESTANGAGGLFYEEWQRADETGYRRHFFPWWMEDRYQVRGPDAAALEADSFTDEEKALVQRWRLSEGQIAFRRKIQAGMRGQAVQEYAEDPVSCFRASGECVFELETIEGRLGRIGRPVTVSDNGRLSIWLPPQGSHRYIIGVDPAGGGSEGDYGCAEVIDRTSGMQCAELHGHYTPGELASKVADLARKYGDALIAVERNNHGHAVLSYLRIVEHATNIYRVEGKDGWLTTAASRPAMIENLAAVLFSAPELFNSERLLNEFRTFVRHADGNSSATNGAHDDCVMAMAIALAVRRSLAGDVAKKETPLELSSLERQI